LAEDPVATITVRVLKMFPASVSTVKFSSKEPDILTAFSSTNLAPLFSACLLVFEINSVPKTPSGKPGKFSTLVVIVNCPPGGFPAITRVFKKALEVYNAAVNPEGPLPNIITSKMVLD